jgi:hypothetical protein
MTQDLDPEKPTLLVQDESGDPGRQKRLQEWVAEGEGMIFETYNVVHKDAETTVEEMPRVDALADAVAERVAQQLED